MSGVLGMSDSTVPDSEPVETMVPTADIIPFPMRLKPAEPEPKDRLTRALESLNTAMGEQKVALATWRGALDALQTSTSGLGESLQRYQSGLGTLAGNVEALHGRAVTMEEWADSVLAR
jgi:hypothetical protein